MPKNVSTPESCIFKYCKEARKSSKVETYQQYETVLLKITNDLKNAGFDPSPYKINEQAVRFLLEIQWKDGEVSTRKWNTHVLSRYIKHFNNFTIRDMDIRWPQDMRPNVDWLTDDEQYKLLITPKTLLEKIVIYLELNLGLRIAEVCNLKIENINFRIGLIEILGKGHGEGKWRSVPFNNDFKPIFDDWIDERNRMVKRVKSHKPNWVDPGNLLIWCHYVSKPEAGPYSERGHSLDRGVIHIVRDRLGLQFTNHTLRRTFGRTAYHAGAPIESISKILGHDDIVTTLKYLGINMDDMQSAMCLHDDYQKKMLIRIRQNRGIQHE